MANLRKRARRLTKLRIDEVSAVTSGAAIGAQVVLMKRDSGGGQTVGEYMKARGMTRRPRFTWATPTT